MIVGSLLVALALPVLSSATPAKNSPCSNCHRINTSVHIKVVKLIAPNKYRATLTGGSGTAAIAGFHGSTKVFSKKATVYTFKTHKGWTYKIYGVKSKTGSRTKTFKAE